MLISGSYWKGEHNRDCQSEPTGFIKKNNYISTKAAINTKLAHNTITTLVSSQTSSFG